MCIPYGTAYMHNICPLARRMCTSYAHAHTHTHSHHSGTDTTRGLQTSRLARVICGVQVTNINKIFGKGTFDPSVWETDKNSKDGYAVYLLVRYAYPHPDAGRRRGPSHRPLCPGELENTHCLWKWTERNKDYRRGCMRDRPWSRHKHLFGDDQQVQDDRKKKEARAWYDVVLASDVICHANVSVDYDRDSSFLQSVMWI